jgi:hypothetical protein
MVIKLVNRQKRSQMVIKSVSCQPTETTPNGRQIHQLKVEVKPNGHQMFE